MVKILLLAVIISLAFSSNFEPRTKDQVSQAFQKYDIDGDDLLSLDELKRYFDNDYMKTFQGIEIDPKFVQASLEYIKSYDIDKNGHTFQQLYKGVRPDKADEKKDKQPHHYPQQQL